MREALNRYIGENIPHPPSKEEASCFLPSKEEISPAAKKKDNHNNLLL